MGKSSGQQPTTDRERIIEWYREDVERYRGMIGEETEYGTVVTVSLINNIEQRIKELEEKERKRNDIRRRLRAKLAETNS